MYPWKKTPLKNLSEEKIVRGKNQHKSTPGANTNAWENSGQGPQGDAEYHDAEDLTTVVHWGSTRAHVGMNKISIV